MPVTILTSIGITGPENNSGELLQYWNRDGDMYEFVLRETSVRQKHELIIFSSLGSFIKKCDVREDHLTVDMRDWSPGIYFLKLMTPEGTYIKKLVKE